MNLDGRDRARRLLAHRVGGPAVTFAAALGGYVALARLGYQLVGSADGMALFWPPNGWIVALLVLSSSKLRLWIVAAVVPGELIADSLQGTSALTALGWGTTNILEATLAAWVLLKVARRRPIGDTRRDVAALTAAAASAPLVGGVFGAAVSCASYGGSYGEAWLNWWLCDATGIMLIVPLVLAFADPAPTTTRRQRVAGLVETALVVGLAGTIFGVTATPVEFLLLPPLVLLGVRHGLRLTAPASILLAITAAICTGRDLGPLASYAAEPRVLGLQTFIATTASIAFLICATMSERRHAEAALADIAMRDPLTSLANRRWFMQRLDELASRRNRSSESAAVVYLDLDDFKETNDRLGHATGDAVLVETGRRLLAAIRESDFGARIGGDEFAALLEPVDGLRGAEASARRIAEAIDGPFTRGNLTIPIRISVGTALVSADSDVSLGQADRRLYRNKQRNRTRTLAQPVESLSVGARRPGSSRKAAGARRDARPNETESVS